MPFKGKGKAWGRGRKTGQASPPQIFVGSTAAATAVAYDCSFTANKTFSPDTAVATAVAYDAVFNPDQVYSPATANAAAVAYDASFGGETPAYGDTDFPQDEQWMIDGYHWMRGLSESVFDYGHVGTALASWDKTYADTDELSRMFFAYIENGYARMGTEGQVPENVAVFVHSKHYVCRAGGGFGWEETGLAGGYQAVLDPGNLGEFFVPNRDNACGHIRPLGANMAKWATFNARNTGDVEINPFYGEDAFKYRGAVVMLAYGIGLVASSQSDTRKFGGCLIGLAITYEHVKSILPDKVKTAFKRCMEGCLNKCATGGTFKPNGNMAAKGIEGAGRAAAIPDWSADTTFQNLCLDAARNLLFGKTDGAIDDYSTSQETGNGPALYHPPGFVAENQNNYDVKYNGRSHNHICTARMYNKDNPDWDFLDELIDRIYDMWNYGLAPTPAPGSTRLWAGDADSGRVWGGATGGFDSEKHSLFWHSGYTPLVAGPSAGSYTDIAGIESVLAQRINSAIGNPAVDPITYDYHVVQSGEVNGVDYLKGVVPNYYDVAPYVDKSCFDGFYWPEETPNVDEEPFVAADLNAILNVSTSDRRRHNDPAETPYGYKTFPPTHDETHGWYGRIQWVAMAFNDWNAKLEGQVKGGGSYQSGQILHFYHHDQGHVIQAIREDKNNKYGTTGIEWWRVFGVWGKDYLNRKFSWTKQNGSGDELDAHYRLVTWDEPTGVFSINTPWDGFVSGTSESLFMLQSEPDLTVAHRKIDYGIETTVTIGSAETDDVDELWLRYPIHTGDYGQNNKVNDYNMDDPAFWTAGSGWTVSGGKATCDGTSSDLSRANNIAAGKAVTVRITTTNVSAGSLTPIIGGASHPAITTSTTQETCLVTLDSASPEIVFRSAGFVGEIDTVFVIQDSPAFSIDGKLGAGSYTALTDTATSYDTVRVGHDWGSGYIYSYLTLSTAKKLKYTKPDGPENPGSRPSYDHFRIGLLDINLHINDPGVTGALTNGTTLTVSLETQ